jgi:hypothetical protein
MQALNNFISDIPGFEGDIPIPTIPISTRAPSGESADDLFMSPGAGSSRTRAGKCKATSSLPPQKRARKVMGKAIGGIKIKEPAPNLSSA